MEKGQGEEGGEAMAMQVVLVDKPPGMTPLAAIEQLRRERPQEFPAAQIKMGYAGRLDPLARGLLICLAGPHGSPLSLQKEIESHSKIYEFQVLFGVETDTYDVMGLVQPRRGQATTTTATTVPVVGIDHDNKGTATTMPAQKRKPRQPDHEAGDRTAAEANGDGECTATARRDEPIKKRRRRSASDATGDEDEERVDDREEEVTIEVNEEMVRAVMPFFTGKRSQAYPPFSSARVKGKPLFQWARQGPEKMREIMPLIPRVQIEIKSLELLSSFTLSQDDLRKAIWTKIGRVKGDFRQPQILQSWDDHYFRPGGQPAVTIFEMRAEVTSGTYIRTLAHEMGQRLGVGAVAFDINRTSVGEHSIDQAIRISSPAD